MYRHRTLAALLLSAATIGLGIGVGTVSAAPTSPQERVDAAYKAMGLTNTVNTLVVKGRMHTWDPGESEDAYKPETGDFGVSTFTESGTLGADSTAWTGCAQSRMAECASTPRCSRTRSAARWAAMSAASTSITGRRPAPSARPTSPCIRCRG